MLNEKHHVEKLIASIDKNDGFVKEILITDGGSEDGTLEKIKTLQQTFNQLHLIENPNRYVSHGFNKAFRQAKGRYISLVGAHAQYPSNYFSVCIAAIESGECEAAGGFLFQQGKTTMGKAIAHVMSSRFGVGDTPFRTTRKRMYVDSVAFAVYDRKVFEKVGLLDEDLIRNQDDEFHYRLNRAGFRILMLPELEVTYYVRDSLGKLFFQYFQYGYYKPMVLRKVRSGLRLRHLIPLIFVLYLLSLPLAIAWPVWLLPLLTYLGLTVFFSLRTQSPCPVRLRMIPIFPALHIAYGTGFLLGLPALWKK
jgi:GT2 family glycosyltransferase